MSIDELPTRAAGPVSKACGTLREALAHVRSGATVAVGGFGACGTPIALVEALLDLGVDDLHIISNNCGQDGRGLALLLKERRIRKFTGSFPGAAFAEHFARGEVELELVPQGTAAERLRAGGAGVPAFLLATGVDTAYADGGVPVLMDAEGRLVKESEPKQKQEFGGRTYVLEEALRPDVALVHAHLGDEAGNLRFRLTARNFNPLAAMAALHTVAQVETLVPTGSIDPDDIHLPGAFVDRIVIADAPLGDADE
ncbi:CoA transferase subunit A [Pseudonocardia zijingensis]|jgi:3-oxoacid CoA-transferase subunit A|uniref:Succinyl-CoA--3-ketoacid CoA transferase subunit A n=1 Tax=Pseudonocardia zijingensis TaxID=153376 RepID=A0ABN1PYC5_9PSEU